jgi:eukaryotic-like serine/threonine-protein kinase
MSEESFSQNLNDTLGLVGITVADKYRVESLVGEGGFAIVYRATHLMWKRPVALKVFKALGDVSAADRVKLLEDFIREGALLAELSEKSASICQARDVGMLTTPGGITVPYMVLEWLEGKSLEAVLLEERVEGVLPRTIEQAVELIEPAAEALALAHKQGIAHRDVKPANIFLLGDPRAEHCPVKLLDFGIAKVVQDAQKVGGAFTKTSGQITSFTPAYGASEQFSRTYGSTGPWTDVFALALVLVEVVTGRPPLEGDDFMQIAYASADRAVRPTPRTRGAGVSDAVEAVFAGALAVAPTDRYRTVGEFWNALRVALGREPVRSFGRTGRTSFLGDGEPDTSSSGTAPHVMSPRAGTPLSAPASVASPYAMTPPSTSKQAVLPAATIITGGGTMVATQSGLHEVGSVPSTSTTNRRSQVPRRAGPALVVAGVCVALGGVGGAVWFLRGKGDVPPKSAATTPGPAAPSASTPPPPPAPPCPTGMVHIDGGQFFMGSDDDLPQEKPAHNVTLSPYCIDRTEVTTEAYVKCSDDGKCKRAGKTNEFDGIKPHDRDVYDPLCNARDTEGKAKHPINCVDWDMADNFCRAIGGRLPTESEWEFAARGPDGRRYPWGDEDPNATRLNACGSECLAWGKKNKVEVQAMYPADDGYANTAPVGSFPAGKSRFGLDDVVGNVWEWVADWSAPYSADKSVDPTGPPKGTTRVIRGGSWNGGEPAWVRPTFRYWNDPKTRSHGVGFRCAANPK